MEAASKIMRERLNDLIKESGRSMGDLSESAGLSRTAIRDIMNGRSKSPGIDTLQAIAVTLNVSLPEIFQRPQSAAQQRILRILDQLSPEEQLRMMGFAEGLSSSQGEKPQKSQG